MDRIPRIINKEPQNLFVYALRSASTKKRLKEIKRQIKRHKEEISFVFIDGYADIIFDINALEENREVIDKFMKWTTKYKIHVCFVLHENKSSIDARGHAGTELTNKSETVFRVIKDQFDPKRCSKVEGEYTRDQGFDPFIFSITDEGLPKILNAEYVKAEEEKYKEMKKQKNSIHPKQYEDKEHMKKLKEWIDLDSQYTRTEIIDNIKLMFKVGRDKAGEFLAWYIKESFLAKTKNDRDKNQRYTFIGNKKKYNNWSYEEL
jgi:RecA-family ATPase